MKQNSEILLINPPLFFKKGYRRPSISIPIGLLFVYSNICNNVDVQFADYLGHKDTDLDNLNKPKGDISDVDIWVGLTKAQIKKEIAGIKIPKYVGINCSFITHSLIPALEIASIIKQIRPDTIIILGGSGVIPGMIDRYKDIDVVYYGEGEKRLFNLLTTKRLSDIKGIEYRENERSKYTGIQDFIDDLDSLNPPDYSRINMEKYIDFNVHGAESRYSYNKNSISFVTSRGCPFKCNFCTIAYVMGKKFRSHSVKYIIKEMSMLKNKYNIKHFHMEDDNISLHMPRFNKLLDAFKKLDITWDPSNGIMVNNFTKSTISKIKESGCKSMRLAPESGSQRILNEVIGKKISLEKIKDVIRWCYEHDLDVIGYLVIGFPQETMEDLQKTIDFASEQTQKYNVRWSVGMANPIIGTSLREYCLKNNMLISNDVMETMGYGYKTRYLIKHPVFSEEYLLQVIKKIQSVFV